jgi:DNA-binding NtrC family response regulator
MKYGATDIFSKPIKTADLLTEIQRVLNERRIPSEAANEAVITTRDPGMMETVGLIALAAPTDAPVLLRGESGTGKELAARMLHRQSSRSQRPFVALNCAAISDELLESEMFGHERGAFTVFLDEIGEMSLRIQAKMLRALQDGRFTRVGGIEPIHVDCRVVSATNRDLGMAIKAGQFREDLYYRVAVVDIHIPPLRDRRADIFPLAEEFLRDFAARYGKQGLSFSEKVLSVMRLHAWPGNVRELKNFVERAVIFSEGREIEIDHVSPQYRTVVKASCGDFHDHLVASATDAIADALERAGGSKTKAAQLLRIDRKTLYNHLKKAKLG